VTHAELVHDALLAIQAPDVCAWNQKSGALPGAGGRPVRFGVVGHSDLMALVGPRARFMALECKVGRDRLSPEQAAFLARVNSLGGIGREIRSVADALAALAECRV